MVVKISKTGVATDNTASGSVIVSGNIDEYSVNLFAGIAYQFDLEGQGIGSNTLISPTLSFLNSGFQNISSNSGVSITNPISGDRRLTVTPTVTSLYYIDVGGSNTGAYQLVSAPHDDFDNGGSTVLGTGITVSGAMPDRGVRVSV